MPLQQEGHLADEDLASGDTVDVGMVAPGKGKKCSLCTKILDQIKARAGENPDEVRGTQGCQGAGAGALPSVAPMPSVPLLRQAAVEAALAKGCRGLGRRLGRVCKRLVGKHREELIEALLGAEDARTVCATIGLCPA